MNRNAIRISVPPNSTNQARNPPGGECASRQACRYGTLLLGGSAFYIIPVNL